MSEGYKLINIEGMNKSIKIIFESIAPFGRFVIVISLLVFIACCGCPFIPNIPSGFVGCLSCLGSLSASALFAAITWRKIDGPDKKFRDGLISKIASVHDSNCSVGNYVEHVKRFTNKNCIANELAVDFPECADCIDRYYEKYCELYKEPAPSFRDGKLGVVSWNTFRSFDTPIGDEYFDAEKFRSLRKKFEEDVTTAFRRDWFGS